MRKVRTITLVVTLLGMLTAAIWFASRTWTAIDGPSMPANGYIAMTLGVVFSLAVGVSLMTLVFYSNRYGYDDAGHGVRPRPEADRD